MRKLTALILCILLLSGCAQTYSGPTETVRVLGESRTEHYFSSLGMVAFVTRTVYAYDIYGNAAQEVSYTDEETTRKTTRRYDEAGKLLEECVYDMTGWFPKRTYKYEHSYDDRGLLRSSILTYGTDRYSHTYTYDEAGRVLTHDVNGKTDAYVYDDESRTETVTGSDGEVTIRHFNALGHLIREERTDSDGTVTLLEYTRREDGQIEVCRTSENGVLTSTEEYRYDELGRPLLHTVTEGGQTRTQARWEYGEQSATEYREDRSYTVTEYDADGNVTCEDRYNENGELSTRTTYSYIDIRVSAGGKEEP